MNWKIRLQNYAFWVGVIGLVGMVVVYFSPGFDFTPVKEILMAALTLCAMLGIVTDPTTSGVADSKVSEEKMSINETAEDVVKKMQEENK